jgi:serine protease Do
MTGTATLLAALLALAAPPDDASLRERLAKDRAAVAAVRDAIGVELAVTESYVRRSIIRTRTPYGFKVRSVARHGIAARAGLEPGHILMEWDGKPIESVAKLLEWIRGTKRGTEVTVSAARRKRRASLFDRQPWETVEVTIVLPKRA